MALPRLAPRAPVIFFLFLLWIEAFSNHAAITSMFHQNLARGPKNQRNLVVEVPS